MEVAQARFAELRRTDPAAPAHVERANFVAAERKANLLRAVIEGSLHSAHDDVARVNQLRERGVISVEEANQVENRLRVLKLILDSAK